MRDPMKKSHPVAGPAAPIADAPYAVPALAMILLGFAVYLPTLTGQWIWDDQLVITGNPLVRETAGLWKIWFAPTQVDYFPVVTTVHWFLWRIAGTDPSVYHLVNIVLHIGSGFLLWRLLTLLGARLGWLAGLIWVVHPLAVESVAQASEIKNTLSQFLALAFLVSYVAWSAEPARRGLYRAAFWLFVAAVLSKSSVVMLPFLLLLFAWWQRGRIGKADLRAVWPFFAGALVFGLVTIWFQSQRGVATEYVPAGGVATRIARAGLAVGFYFLKCVLPVNLMPIYPRWVVDPPSLLQFLPWPFLAGVFGWLWLKRNTWGRTAILGLGFFLLNLVPILGFVTMSYMWVTWTADHFAYLSLAGIIGLAVVGADAALAALAGLSKIFWRGRGCVDFPDGFGDKLLCPRFSRF